MQSERVNDSRIEEGTCSITAASWQKRAIANCLHSTTSKRSGMLRTEASTRAGLASKWVREADQSLPGYVREWAQPDACSQPISIHSSFTRSVFPTCKCVATTFAVKDFRHASLISHMHAWC